MKRACLQHDALSAARQLLAWGQAQDLINGTQGLRALALGLGENELKQRLLALDQVLYAQQSESWQGKSTWQAFKRYRPGSAGTGVQNHDLPSLYPGAG